MMHGGWADAPPFARAEEQNVEATIDALIPPEGGWPPAADLGVADTIRLYLVPDESSVSFYPHFRRSEFLDVVRSVVVPNDSAATSAALEALESDNPSLFSRVRDFVFYAYYGTTAVVGEVRSRTRFGGNYNGAPQPHGYPGTEQWDGRRTRGRGTFIPTVAVRRVRSEAGAHA
jgi:hypothetical protein